MRLRHTYFIILLFQVITAVNIWAQDEKVTGNIASLTHTWEFYYPLGDTLPCLEVNEVFNLLKYAKKPVVKSPESDILREEIAILRKDPGLDITSNYLENFNPGLGDDDDNLIYNRRIQAGLNWQILNNGFLENKMQANKLENNLYLKQSMNFQEFDSDDYADQWNRIIYLFNSEKIKILDLRKSILNDLEDKCSELYLLKFISRENYLKIVANKTETESMYRIYSDYNSAFEKLHDSIVQKVNLFPVFDIRYDSIVYLLEQKKTIHDSALWYFNENMKIEKSWVHDISLSTSLRYNYYNLVTDNPATRNFFTLGVNFSMPLAFNYGHKKQLASLRSDYEKYIYENKGNEFHREVLNDCYEYRYKIKQYESFCQKRNLMEEKLRRYNALKDVQDLDFNPVEALNALDEYLAVKIEMIDLTQNLYLKFLRISSYFGNGLKQGLTEPFEIPEGYESAVAMNRSVYIWSSAFEKHSAVFIREYLFYNRFEKSIVSVNSDTSYCRKLNEFLPHLKKAGIEVELMIGDNSILEQSDYAASIDSKIKNINSGLYSGIHFDVEPHTFPDWETKKSDYLKKMLDLLQKARTMTDAKGLKLSVSIPLHYPEEIIHEIFSICDHVCFMAYENTNSEYITRKTEPFKSQKDKWVIASSVKDFGNRPELEDHLLKIYQATGCVSYAIHDFNRLVELDEQNIEIKK
jgi:hypothetical protein